MLPLRYNKYMQASSLFIARKALTTEDVCTYYVPCTMYVHELLHGDPMFPKYSTIIFPVKSRPQSKRQVVSTGLIQLYYS